MGPKHQKNYFSVVPWMNSEQFNKVYSCLYSNSLSKKRWAIDQISVWDTRCFPSLPTAVESTCGLVRAKIHDMLYQADKTFCQEGDIQMLYCIALIRFVSLTLEHHQKAEKKMSLSFLAEKHNIPMWLIDLRNEAVHSFYPSLSMLRMGADIALKYLEETFWATDAAHVKPKTNFPTSRDAEMEDVINHFKNLRFQKVKDGAFEARATKQMKSVLKKISSFISQDGGDFIEVLVKPGNFIAAEDFNRLSKEAGLFTIEDNNLKVPPILMKFWMPVIRKIHRFDLIPVFLEKLLVAQEKCCNRLCQKMAVAWAKQILLEDKQESLLGKHFQKKGLLLNMPCIVYACMKGVNPYSMPLLHLIVQKLSDVHKYNGLFHLLAVYQGYCVPKESPSSKRKKDIDNEIIFTVEDLEEDCNELRAKKMRSGKDVNVWSSPSVTMDFSDVPIGGIVNPADLETTPDKQIPDDSWKENIKLRPSIDDNFIIVNKNDGEGTIEEEITHDKNTFPITTRPENFDMVYRRRPKQ